VAARVTITVDDDEVQALVRRVEGGMDRLVVEVADDLAGELAQEAQSASSRLGRKWEVTGSGDEVRHIEAPEWWAHFLAGGTREHGPVTAQRLTFEVNGNFVSASHVRGIPANPFDERAIRTTQRRVDDIVRRLISTGGRFL
jgi:hypothetical protein